MKYALFLISLILGLGGLSHAQQELVSQQPPNAASTTKFWNIENKVNFSIFSAELVADAFTTQRALNQEMREANPLARPFVTHGAAGQAGASALSLAAGVGAAYLLHRIHHHKAERIAVRLMIIGEGAVVAHNVVLCDNETFRTLAKIARLAVVGATLRELFFDFEPSHQGITAVVWFEKTLSRPLESTAVTT